MTGRSQTERILDAYLAPESDRLPNRVIDAALADVARTPQRRATRVPWRFPTMTNTMRAAAAIAIVAIVGVGALLAFNPGNQNGIGSAPTPTADALPTVEPTAAPTLTGGPTASPACSEVARGICAWKTYTSEVYGFDFGYPDDWTVFAPATREWQAGDTFESEEHPYAESFVRPPAGMATGVALNVWRMPVAATADVGSLEGLEAWAEATCSEIALCAYLPDRALPMCLGKIACGPALLVPDDALQVGFIAHPSLELVTIVMVGRPDSHPTVLRYGGGNQLLKSILTTMDVWTPEPGQTPG